MANGTAGVLVLVGTPLGNRGDLSPRAREAILGADLLLCEDTRSPIRLLGDGRAAAAEDLLLRRQRGRSDRAVARAPRPRGAGGVRVRGGAAGVERPGAAARAGGGRGRVRGRRACPGRRRPRWRCASAGCRRRTCGSSGSCRARGRSGPRSCGSSRARRRRCCCTRRATGRRRCSPTWRARCPTRRRGGWHRARADQAAPGGAARHGEGAGGVGRRGAARRGDGGPRRDARR
jgi:hypothetical protein